MNKCTIIALLAAIGCVAVIANGELLTPEEVESKFAFIPKDAEESGFLTDDKKVFTSFCHESRDFVKKTMADSANSAAADLFRSFFDSANKIGDEVIMISKKVAAEKAEAIKEGQQEAAAQLTLLGRIKEAAWALFTAARDATIGQFLERIEELKENVGAQQVKKTIGDVCRVISNTVGPNIDNLLEKEKRAAKKETGNDYSAITVSNVGCVTSGRIFKVTQFCNFITLAGPALYPILGL